ncbi:MAG TPA: gamma carbonic anhydrase family protein [Chloroflexota bacterium]|nr:gamma carbonic anhydrase family protein [Chloroflexota bacterium]
MPVHAYRGVMPTIGRRVFIADGAHIIGHVTLADDVNIWFNAVLRGDIQPITVGARTNIQDNCTVHVDYAHPAVIGEDVTIGHGVTVHGCTIERQVLVGMNAVLLTGCTIGWGSIVGANALVTEGKVIPPRSLVLGSPGRVVRTVSDAELAELLESADGYVREAATYMGALTPQ